MDCFQNNVALVTGASSDIGSTVCRLLADRGALVIATDTDLRAVQALAIGSAGRIIGQQLDVCDPEAVNSVIERIVSRHGRLDVVVNNPGVDKPRLATTEYPLEEWHSVLSMNLHGAFHVMKYAITHMLPRRSGTIVNIAPLQSASDWGGSAAFVATRHALVGMTRSAAAQYASCGLRINAIGPGFTDLPQMDALHPSEYAARVGLYPAGHLDSAYAVAELACRLLSAEPQNTNGAYHLLDVTCPAV